MPCCDKKNTRLIISEIILDVFKSLKMAYPKLGEEQMEELKSIRAKLVE